MRGLLGRVWGVPTQTVPRHQKTRLAGEVVARGLPLVAKQEPKK